MCDSSNWTAAYFRYNSSSSRRYGGRGERREHADSREAANVRGMTMPARVKLSGKAYLASITVVVVLRLFVFYAVDAT